MKSKHLLLFLLLFVFVFSLTACNNSSEKKQNTDKKDTVKTSQTQTKQTTTSGNDYSGNYVSDGYEQRKEGFDWVAVTVKNISADEIFVSVRSRADKKKPTCTFDTKAFKVNDTSYSTVADGKKIIISFNKKSITIQPEKREDEAALYSFCSGGATVAGTYLKVNEPLDATQIDKTLFSKILRLQDVGFNVTAKPKDGKVEVEIYPFGLSLENQTIKQLVEGSVVDAEAEDLDADGLPEVAVFIYSEKDKKGDVIGTSVISKKAMIQFYFPSVSDPKIKEGYNGNDKFTFVERNLVQQFPVFSNGKETGKIRQVSYTLEKGENTKVFKVKNIQEFDKK